MTRPHDPGKRRPPGGPRDDTAAPHATPEPLGRGARPPRRGRADPDPLDRALADAVLGDADGAAWRDERFVAWWAERASTEARSAAAALPDDEFLTRGVALMERVRARLLGFARLTGAPPWRRPGVPGSPAQVIDRAAALAAAPVVGDADLAAAAGVGRDLWDEPCDAWVDLPRAAPPGRYVALRVRGDSMVPLLASGDTVLVRLDPEVHADTVVIARHPDDGYVCKRVRRVGALDVELDSLSPDGPELVIPRDPRLVLGTVVVAWQGR